MKRKTRNNNYHEVDSFDGNSTFDEASYYEGDRFELGGVDFGDQEQERARNRQRFGRGEWRPEGGPESRFDYWDEGVGEDHADHPRVHQHGWDRPGRRSSDYGIPKERISKYTPRTDYHGSADDNTLDIGHYGKGPKGYERSDERIHEEVCELLTHDEHIDATDIMVEVKKGEVFLTGTVSGRKAKKLAQRKVEDLRGVRKVHNELKLQSVSANGLSQRAVEESQRFKIA